MTHELLLHMQQKFVVGKSNDGGKGMAATALRLEMFVLL